MAKEKAIKNHTVANIWQNYSLELLGNNANYVGVSHNKISNYFIYDRYKMSERKVDVKYKSVFIPKETKSKRGRKLKNITTRTWKTSVYGSAGLVFSYEYFKKIITTYLTRAKKEIINGNAVDISGIGKICAFRRERDFRLQYGKDKRRVNWGETLKIPKEWDETLQKFVRIKFIYFTDDDWCRIGWFKSLESSTSPYYEFAPTKASSAGIGGFKAEFSKELMKDPLLKYQYLYIPIKAYQYAQA